MKRLEALIIISVLILAGAWGGWAWQKSRAKEPVVLAQEQVQKKRPKIPKKPPKAEEVKTPQASELVSSLIDLVNKKASNPVISEADIKRGYYFAQKEQKKIGTPLGWTWIEDGAASRYASPSGEAKYQEEQTKAICEETGGAFDDKRKTCACPEGSGFLKEEGCLKRDPQNPDTFLAITKEDVLQGWYLAQPYEKKQGTPPNWKWSEESGGRYQNMPDIHQ